MARARLKSILTALIFSGVITSCGTANSGSEPVQEYTSGDSENITPLASAVPTPPTTPVNENLSGYAGSDTEFVSNLPKVALILHLGWQPIEKYANVFVYLNLFHNRPRGPKDGLMD